MRQPELSTIGNDLYARLYGSVIDIIESGVDAGKFKLNTDAHSIAEAAVALCDGLGTRVMSRDPNLTMSDARRIIATSVGILVGHVGPLPLVDMPDPSPQREEAPE